MHNLTFLVTFYNKRKEHINKCLESLEKYAPEARVFVWDDGSDETHKEYLREAVASYCTNCEVIYNKENVGVVTSLNESLKHIDTEYVCRVDADDFIVRKIEFKFDKDMFLKKLGASCREEIFSNNKFKFISMPGVIMKTEFMKYAYNNPEYQKCYEMILHEDTYGMLKILSKYGETMTFERANKNFYNYSKKRGSMAKQKVRGVPVKFKRLLMQKILERDTKC